MKIAITGASGFLGGSLAEAYHKRGDDIIALVRKSSDTSMLEQLGARLIVGELTEAESFTRLVEGCDIAIHCAAKATDFGPWEEFQTINVEASKMFFEACLKAKTGRALYISSVAVYGNGRNHRGTDEEAPYESIITDNYTRSKIMAERIAYDFIDQHKLPLVIIRPGYIWGNGDKVVLPRMIEAFRKRQVAVINDGSNLMNLSHVENVVQGIMLAAEDEKASGRVYNLTDGSKVTTRRFLEDIAEIIGIDMNIRSFPYAPAYIAASFAELFCRIIGYRKSPPITRYAVKMGNYDQVFDISRAIYELGYKPKVKYKEGMAGLIRYARRLYYGQK